MLGGTERYVLDLARAQVKAGHRVTVFTLDRDVVGVVQGRLAATELTEGIRIIRVPGVGTRRAAVTFRPDALMRAMRASDVVHLHDLRFAFGSVSLAARVLSRPLLFHTHGLIFHTRWAFGFKRAAVRLVFGPLLRFSRAQVIADSEPDRDMLVELAPYLAERTRILQDAIDISALLSLRRTPIRGLVVSLGRVASSKRIDRLLRTLAGLGEADWTLRIAGPGEQGEVERLKELAAGLGIGDRVEFSGSYPANGEQEILSGAYAAAFPSTGEGFGLALLEAMAAGVPVVANDIPAHRSLLGPELGDRLVDFDDAAASAAAVEAVLHATPELLASIERRERARAAEYGIDRLTAQIDGLYRELFEDAPGG
jgi:phosphatidylinositol alpha-mannosyltransferase